MLEWHPRSLLLCLLLYGNFLVITVQPIMLSPKIIKIFILTKRITNLPYIGVPIKPWVTNTFVGPVQIWICFYVEQLVSTLKARKSDILIHPPLSHSSTYKYIPACHNHHTFHFGIYMESYFPVGQPFCLI